jgi:hypothetical protein
MLLLGITCFGIGYVATDAWLASGRELGWAAAERLRHMTLGFAVVAIYLALQLSS